MSERVGKASEVVEVEKKDVRELFNNENSVEMDNPFPSKGNGELDEDFILDPQRTKSLEDNLSLPAGQYKWNKERVAEATKETVNPTIRKRYIEDDKEIGDLSSNGRLVYNVSGIVAPAQEGRKGRFSFDISPDIRYKRDDEGNISQPKTNDFANDNWAKCSKLYFSKYDGSPKGTRDVLDMLQQGMYFMYITLSKNGGNFLGNMKGM